MKQNKRAPRVISRKNQGVNLLRNTKLIWNRESRNHCLSARYNYIYNTLSCSVPLPNCTITNLYLDWNGPSVPIDHCSYQERSGHDAEAMFYAPNNVNPVGGLGGEGGVRARNGDLTNFKIFWSNSQGSETKGQSKVSKEPYPRGKNLTNNTIILYKTNKRTVQKSVLTIFI